MRRTIRRGSYEKSTAKATRTIWVAPDSWGVEVIDQTKLPFAVETKTLRSWREAADAIPQHGGARRSADRRDGVYGLALAMREDPSDANLAKAYAGLLGTRPTAINLRWGLDDLRGRLEKVAPFERMGLAYRRAATICDEDVETCMAIGRHGLGIIRQLWKRRASRDRFNVLTHCNAGWLACIDWGTALSPIYMAFEAGIPVHVWVDETRPSQSGRQPDGVRAWAARRRPHGDRPTTSAVISCSTASSDMVHRRQRPHHRDRRRLQQRSALLESARAQRTAVPLLRRATFHDDRPDA